MSRFSFRPPVPVVALVVLGAAAACGPARRGSGEARAALIFANESIDQATVYVVAPGVEFRRVGTVIPGRTDTLTVPHDLVLRGTVNVVARLLARPELPQTGPVSIRAGELYRVRLTPDAKILSFLPDGS